MKAKVLIVDDDQDIVTMLQDRLDASGYRTFTAGDGQRGIELIEQESPNLVLLDLYLPRLKGMDVSEAYGAEQADRRHSSHRHDRRRDHPRRRRSHASGRV